MPLCAVLQSGADYSFLVSQNTKLLSALEDLQHRCSSLAEENSLLVSRRWCHGMLCGEGFLDTESYCLLSTLRDHRITEHAEWEDVYEDN